MSAAAVTRADLSPVPPLTGRRDKLTTLLPTSLWVARPSPTFPANTFTMPSARAREIALAAGGSAPLRTT